MTLGKDILNLLKRPSCSLREAEEDVDKSGEVECAEDEVGLVGNARQARRDSPSEGKVKQPVYVDQSGMWKKRMLQVTNS